MAELEKLLSSLEISTPLIQKASDSLDKLNETYLGALAQYEKGKIDELQSIDKLVKGMDRAPTAQIDEIVEFVRTESEKQKAATLDLLHARFKKSIIVLSLFIILGLLIGSIVTWRVIKGISNPLEQAVSVAQTVASGDLTKDITVTSDDETGQVLKALSEMNDSLKRIVTSVLEGTESIASSTAEIAESNQSLSTRTVQQASSLDQTASTMEELTSTERANADNAGKANTLSSNASKVAVRGGSVVKDVVDTMKLIDESSQKMAHIITVIDGIAFQTNILALNAAVEAARAGEQGRGFAVVADEVRSLAAKSADTARDIRELIDTSVEKVMTGTKLVETAGTTMDEVVSSITEVNDIVAQITAASEEQCTSIEQVNEQIVEMNRITQENAAMVEEAAAATQTLESEAKNLSDQMLFFTIAQGASREPVVKQAHRPAKRIEETNKDHHFTLPG